MIWLEQVWNDLRYASRVLAASPGFTGIAVLSLAIGVGANSAMFSFADALLLRPLPVARPGEIFTVGSVNGTTFSLYGGNPHVSSYRDYVDIRDRNTSFDGLAAFVYAPAGFARDSHDIPRMKMGMLVSGNLFEVMGVQPAIGRTFLAAEDQVPGRDAVIVLGHTLFEQEFALDPAVLGRSVRINGETFTIIGVAPPEFTGLEQFIRADFFAPMMMSPRLVTDPEKASLEARDVRTLQIKGRLKPDRSQAEAQAELTTIATDLERAHPDTNRNERFAIRTELQARMIQDPPDSTLVAMLAMLAFGVLVVACANVAGLLTSRAPTRAREMALRLAIGAGRGRLVGQLLTESLLIAFAGGVAGLGVGYGGLTLFRQIEMPTDLPISLAFHMDRRALTFSLIVAVASAVFFGLVPALQATGSDLVGVLKTSDGVSRTGKRRWGRGALVGSQVAVSFVLLALSMFVYRGFLQQVETGPGYRTDHRLMMTLDTSFRRYTAAQSRQFFEQLGERVRNLPEVTNATLATSLPMLNESVTAEAIVPEDFQLPIGQDDVTVLTSGVDEFYFDTMGIAILQGRNFTVDDSFDAPRVAIVNEQFAQHYWPDKSPIGKRFRLIDPVKTWVEIVGVAKMSKYLFIGETPTEFIYLPRRQNSVHRVILLAQSAGDPAALAAPLRAAVRTLDTDLPIYNVRTMDELYRMRTIRVFNVLTATVAALGTMGLGLCIVGLYGLVAYTARRRTREIGIRMAIGASRGAVLRMVIRQGLVLALAGLVVGFTASVGVGELLRAVFPIGDNRRDAVALAIVVTIVFAVTLLALYIPARRAADVSPVQALRDE